MLQLGMSLSGWMVGMLVMSGKGMVATVGHIGLVVGGPGLGPARSVQGPESTLASTSNAHRRKKERKEGDFCLKFVIRLVHLKKGPRFLKKGRKNQTALPRIVIHLVDLLSGVSIGETFNKAH